MSNKDLELLCEADHDTKVGTRRYIVNGDEGVEVVLENVRVNVDPGRLSLWDSLRLAVGTYFNQSVTVPAYVSVVFKRQVAVALNDELIDSLYYDESGNHVG